MSGKARRRWGPGSHSRWGPCGLIGLVSRCWSTDILDILACPDVTLAQAPKYISSKQVTIRPPPSCFSCLSLPRRPGHVGGVDPHAEYNRLQRGGCLRLLPRLGQLQASRARSAQAGEGTPAVHCRHALLKDVFSQTSTSSMPQSVRRPCRSSPASAPRSARRITTH